MGVIEELVLPMAILVLTRPLEASLRFLAQVEEQAGLEVRSIISPLFEVVEMSAVVETSGKELVLTSANGVSGAKRLGFERGSKAYCVGARTAEVAELAGFDAISAEGNADDLVRLIADERSTQTLVHVHGEHTRGNVAERLNELGFHCESVTTYRQVICPPSEALINALHGNDPLLVPLFSPRSALIFGLAEDIRAPLHVIAMSQAVAAEVSDLGADTVRVVENPETQAMVAATCHRLFELLSPPIA